MGCLKMVARDRLNPTRQKTTVIVQPNVELGWLLDVRPSEKAWAVLVIGIVSYEIAAHEGELLSEQIDRWLDRHRLVTTAAVTITAAHLLNWLPARLDPFQWVSTIRRGSSSA